MSLFESLKSQGYQYVSSYTSRVQETCVLFGGKAPCVAEEPMGWGACTFMV